MKLMPKFESKEEVLEAIDNGGRFYNLMSKANDNIVTAAELAKAAGAFSSGKNAYLFLSLALVNLSEADQQSVIGSLDLGLRSAYQSQKPRLVSVEDVEECKAGDVVIVEAYLQKIEEKSNFSGFIYTPIMVGEITTFTMTPIFDAFTLYKATVRCDDADATNAYAYVTTPLNSNLSQTEKMRLGGYIRELVYKDADKADRQFYLETAFACPT